MKLQGAMYSCNSCSAFYWKHAAHFNDLHMDVKSHTDVNNFQMSFRPF